MVIVVFEEEDSCSSLIIESIDDFSSFLTCFCSFLGDFEVVGSDFLTFVLFFEAKNGFSFLGELGFLAFTFIGLFES